MPRRKIIIGIPTYGRGWTLNSTKPSSCHIGLYAASPSNATKFVVESGVAAYYEICEMLTKGAKRCWDAEGAVPYLVYENQWFTYDDVESIQRKVCFDSLQLIAGQHF
ncbi:unnamed protein product [Anisakis simplex]|uniref:Cht7 (inferred by orthology to a D. melanogaster protein) n=1 Tax=Anisakis simplex TaxID=6269 RepID=A0A0M3JB84_ANISI|nr:unnamed protein product [Anisakis simplex]